MKRLSRFLPFVLAVFVTVALGTLTSGTAPRSDEALRAGISEEQLELEKAALDQQRHSESHSYDAAAAEEQEYRSLFDRITNGGSLSEAEKARFDRLEQLYGEVVRPFNPLDNQGGPDGFGYVYVDNQGGDTATYNWIELRGDPDAVWLNYTGSHDDAVISGVPLGFDFPFYGGIYNAINVSTNGTLQFTTALTTYTNVCLPTTSFAGPVIFPYWDDLHLDYGGNGVNGNNTIAYRNFGNYWVIEFDSIGHCCSAGTSLKFQVILYNSGRIKMQYNNLVFGSNANTQTIGIQQAGAAGSNALTYVCNTTGIQPVNDLAIWFTLPNGIPQPITNLQGTANGSNVTLTWTDPALDINGNAIVVDSVQLWLGPAGTGTRLAAVGPGLQTYTHVNAPDGNLVYSARPYNEGWAGTPVSINVIVGTPFYSQNFEATNGGWNPTPPAGGWEWGTPTAANGPAGAHSGTNLWGTVLAANYPNSACLTLDLNPGASVQSPSASVEFWAWYNTETSYDGCHFKASTDGGSTWELVTPVGGYPQASVLSNTCIGANTPSWAGNSNGWIYVVLPIGQYQGQAPLFRFVFGTNASGNTYPGFFIDDMLIWGMQGTADGPPSPVTNFQGVANGNNVTLTWTDPNQDISGNPIVVDSIQVWLGPVGTGTRIGAVGPGVQTFTHNNSPSGNNTYSVRPYNNGFPGSGTSIQLIVGNPSYVQGFETDNGGWVSDGGWEWGAPTSGPNGAYNGTNLWGTILAGNYANSACYTMTLSLGMAVESPTATVEFWRWYDTEASFDGCNFKVSTDQGTTWELVTPTDGYTGTTNTSSICLPSQPAWTGHNGGQWTYVVLPIGQYLGQVVDFKFTFSTDGSVVYHGFYLDDMIMWGLTVPSDGPPVAVGNLQGTANGNNVTLTWTDPTVDVLGNPITVDSIQVWLGPVDTGTRLGAVGPGVQTFTQNNSPSGNNTYSVRPYNNGYIGNASAINLIVGNPSYVQDFEVDSGWWVAEPADGWQWGVPTSGPNGAHSGSNLWGTVLNGDYIASACYTMTLSLGLVVESPTATVEFWRWYDTEASYDGCNFKVSTDQGATWELVTPVSGYTGTTNTTPCIPSQPAWTGHNGGAWVRDVMPIGQYVGQVPQFRFTFGADAIIHYAGFYLDDMIIWGMGVPEEPVGVSANGNFDDRIRVNWMPMNTAPAGMRISYDNGHSSPAVDGLGWWGSRPEAGWLVSRYNLGRAVDVTGVTAFFTDFATAGAPVQLGVFADAGDGTPAARPLAVVDAVQHAPFDEYRSFELDSPVHIADGSFFVGVRQMSPNPLALGGDESVPFIRNTFFHSSAGGEWSAFEPAMMMVPMLGATLADASLDAGVPAARVARELGPVARQAVSAKSRAVDSQAFEAKQLDAPVPSYKASLTTVDAWRMAGREFFAVDASSPNAAPVMPNRVSNPLDEVLYYKIYRNNTFLANDTLPPYDDIVGTNNEGVTYSYFITAWFDDGTESGHSDTVSAAANMAPGQPGNVTGTPQGQSQMRITWTDPTVNADGTPLVDLAMLAVYRNGTLLGTVNPGVQQYTDTPPEPTTFYVWSVRARDEVPNEGPAGSVSGAVQSPWIQIPYEWIDISNDGTDVGIANDDQNVGPFPLGFDVEFYGNTFNSIRVCSNGWISFTSTVTTYSNVAIPATAEPNNALYPFWDDLYPPSGGFQIKYRSDANPQRFIVSYINIAHISSSSARYTFQVVIEPNGGITFAYQQVATAAPGITSSTIGVENGTGTEALQLALDGTGDFLPTDESAVQFWGGPSGSIEGIVRRQTGSVPLPGVLVEALELPVSTVTDDNGYYSLGIEPGIYSVRYSLQGYCDSTITNVLVEDNQATTRNITLRAPQSSFSVTSISEFTWPGHDVTTSFTIGNPAGQCPLQFTISDTSAWLSVQPATGTVGPNQTATITVTMSVGALTPGMEYTSQLVITHNANNSPRVIPVTLNISLDAGDPGEAMPTEFALRGNYPNPFNALTEIRFDLPQAANVRLALYNVLGQEVRELVNGSLPAGRHAVVWNGPSDTGLDMTSGLYIVRLDAGERTFIGKMMLLK